MINKEESQKRLSKLYERRRRNREKNPKTHPMHLEGGLGLLANGSDFLRNAWNRQTKKPWRFWLNETQSFMDVTRVGFIEHDFLTWRWGGTTGGRQTSFYIYRFHWLTILSLDKKKTIASISPFFSSYLFTSSYYKTSYFPSLVFLKYSLE